MEINLSVQDILELSRALKNGKLNIDKVSRLRDLKANYRPPKSIGGEELEYYLNLLMRGWGYAPTSSKVFAQMLLQGDVAEKHKKYIESGRCYRQLIKDAFIGLLAIRALGGKFYNVEPDFSFENETPPSF